MRRLLTIAALLITAGLAAAQVEVAGVLRQPDVLGYLQPATLEIVVAHPTGAQVTFPDPPRLPAMIMTNADAPVSETIDEGTTRTTRTYTFDAFGPIREVIPALNVTVDGEDYPLPAFVLDRPDLSDSKATELAAPLDIVPPRTILRRTAPPAWQIGLCTVALLALVAGGAWWYLRRRGGAATPALPAWDAARQRLRELKHRKLPEAGKYGTYYVDLSAILRYYIEDRFHLHAPEQTTPEFLAAASASGLLTADQQSALSDFLRQSDRVKFARYRPSVDEMVEDFEVVDRFVTDTTPGPDEGVKQEATS